MTISLPTRPGSFEYHLTAILIVWAALSAICVVAYIMVPTDPLSPMSLLQQCCMMLTGVSFLVLALRDPNRRYRTIEFNFFVFSGLVQIIETVDFLGLTAAVWPGPFVRLYGYQYVTCGLLPLTQLFATTFACTILLRDRVSALSGYLISGLVAAAAVLLFYLPIIDNPRYVYTVREITDFRIIDREITTLRQEGKRITSAEIIAQSVGLSAWDQNMGELQFPSKVKRVNEILPYVEGRNHIQLLMKPVYRLGFLMNLIIVLIILSYSTLLFHRDPPTSPYIDRILFVFLCYSAIQALDYFVYMQTINFENYLRMYQIGTALSVVVSLLVPPFVWLRLKFVLSAEGHYYEKKIEHVPHEVSRWRDEIDNFVIKHLAKKSKILRRFITSRATGEGGQETK